MKKDRQAFHQGRPGPTFSDMLSVTPEGAPTDGEWQDIQSLWPDRFEAMALCPQSPEHHGEGDVLTHTRMVVTEMTSLPAWHSLDAHDRARLFWTAVLHDIGKPASFRLEDDGHISTRGHSRVGAQIARGLLWRAGAPFEWREEICGIINFHQLPFWHTEREDPLRLAIETSWRCNTRDLIIHANADARGRICQDQQRILDQVSLSEMQFEEAECLGAARRFPNAESRLAYFIKPDRDPNYEAREDHPFTVTLMSALPGSGKDHWIRSNGGGQPVVSLDAIRQEMGAAGTGKQGQVVQAAKEAARVYLRAKESFIYNATNITRQMREPLLALFRSYGARTRIIYLEADPATLLKQNNSRDSAIPDAAVMGLADKLEPPDETEAHDIVRVIASPR